MSDPGPDSNAAGEETPAYQRTPPPSSPSAVVAGMVLAGRYQIIGPLGKGGMGEVYRAHDARLGRDVAIKVLPASVASAPGPLARFEREARAVAALSHPNILAIHDYGTDQGITYAATELLEGRTLRERLADGPLPWRDAVAVGIAIAEGLAAAHGKGIIHRDLKPANLFLTADGRVKILDFGLARMDAVQAPTGAETATFSPALTESGAVMGTVGYMSPEQVRGDPADARSDLFALGCVLFEMVSGSRPFARPTATETQAAILRDDPPALAGAPPELERLIRRCLQKDCTARFQSARDLASSLNALLQEQLPAHRFRPGHLITAAILVIVLGIAVYLFTHNPGSRDPGPPATTPDALDTLAVLPFTNESQDAEAGYLGDDITFSLTDSLGRFRELKVRPFRSASRLKDMAPVAAGRELEVRAVLTGTIQKRGAELRVVVELIDVREDRSLWQKRYGGKFADRLSLQSEIVLDIPDQLRLALTGEQKRDLAKPPTTNLKAHEEYVRGRLEWNKRTAKSLEKSIDHFKKAIAEDPNFALAHAGLADVYLTQGTAATLSMKDAVALTRAALKEALRIDPNLAEAHITEAGITGAYEWKWLAAESLYRKALALKPNYPTGHHWFSLHLAAVGRLDEALVEAREAERLDPTSPKLAENVALMLYFARRYDESIQHMRARMARDPDVGVFYRALAAAYSLSGRHEEAKDAMRKAVEVDDTPAERSGLAFILARAGDKREAREILGRLSDDIARGRVDRGELAMVHLALGDRDEALRQLELAYDEHSVTLAHLHADPVWDPLRSDARFNDLLQRIGLIDKIPAKDAPIDTIAILLFANESKDAESGHLGDDITFSLTESLARFRDLKVRPFSSASRIKDKEPIAAGKELQARAVLTGTISKRGDGLTVLVELIDVREDRSLWQKRYEGRFADRLALQSAIVLDIPEQLRLALTGEQKRDLAKLPTTNLKAHELYVRGRIEWNRRTAKTIEKSIDYYKRAIAEDPKFALAYAGLADAYLLNGATMSMPMKEAVALARAPLAEALRLDPNLAEAHITSAGIKAFHEWDWAGAEKEYRKGIALKPNYPTGHHSFSLYLTAVGRLEEALAEAQEAERLDPTSPMLAEVVAYMYYFAGRYDEAIRHLRARIDREPADAVYAHALARVYMVKGMHKEAIDAMRKVVEAENTSATRCLLAHVLARCGEQREAREILGELREDIAKGRVDPGALALVYLGLGDRDEALRQLERAYEQRSYVLWFVRTDPVWNDLRSEPRFQAIVKKLNFPP